MIRKSIIICMMLAAGLTAAVSMVSFWRPVYFDLLVGPRLLCLSTQGTDALLLFAEDHTHNYMEGVADVYRRTLCPDRSRNGMFHWWYTKPLPKGVIGCHSGPSRVLRASAPLWLPFLLFTSYPAYAFIRGPLLRHRRRKRGECIVCGYNLTGLPEPRCPECGEVHDP